MESRGVAERFSIRTVKAFVHIILFFFFCASPIVWARYSLPSSFSLVTSSYIDYKRIIFYMAMNLFPIYHFFFLLTTSCGKHNACHEKSNSRREETTKYILTKTGGKNVKSFLCNITEETFQERLKAAAPKSDQAALPLMCCDQKPNPLEATQFYKDNIQ
jgi:hypothetical protein